MSKGILTIIDRLNLIQESILQIELYSSEIKNPNDFLLSPHGMVYFDACILRLQVIGETVRRLFCEKDNPLVNCPDIPWKEIIGLRNIISHEYLSVDEVIIFDIIKNEIPSLKQAIQKLID
ncbi:HepT-like ribonuclease domain-containing protein [Parabacteroides sp.]